MSVIFFTLLISLNPQAHCFKNLRLEEIVTLKVENDPRKLFFTPDGKTLVLLFDSNKNIMLLNVSNLNNIKSKKISHKKGDISKIAISPDSKTLATTTHPWKAPYNIRLWDISNWQHKESIFYKDLPFENYISDFAFSPDWKKLVSLVHNSITWWDVSNWQKQVKQIETIRSPKNSSKIAFNPNGTMLAIVSDSPPCLLWRWSPPEKFLLCGCELWNWECPKNRSSANS